MDVGHLDTSISLDREFVVSSLHSVIAVVAIYKMLGWGNFLHHFPIVLAQAFFFTAMVDLAKGTQILNVLSDFIDILSAFLCVYVVSRKVKNKSYRVPCTFGILLLTDPWPNCIDAVGILNID